MSRQTLPVDIIVEETGKLVCSMENFPTSLFEAITTKARRQRKSRNRVFTTMLRAALMEMRQRRMNGGAQ